MCSLDTWRRAPCASAVREAYRPQLARSSPRLVSPHPCNVFQHGSPNRWGPRRQNHRWLSRRATAEGCPSPQGRQDPWTFVRVVLPLALALMLCNMDRICLSVAILPMSKEFGWPEGLQVRWWPPWCFDAFLPPCRVTLKFVPNPCGYGCQGVIQSAFLLGYMATGILGGFLADKYGGKRVLAGGIIWFSLASLLLPLALSPPVAAAGLTLQAVLLARCCVGLGEGVALPAMNNMVASYIPRAAKARALGVSFTGFHLGSLMGLILSPLILLNFGWRTLFFIFGALGAPLLALWIAMVPQKPAQAQDGTPAEAAGYRETRSPRLPVKDINVMTLLSHPATWAIITVNIVNHWGYFIYLNWMPTFFFKVLDLDLKASSFLSFLPWLMMALGSSLAGLLADGLIARGVTVVATRKLVQTVAFLVPAAALLVLSLSTSLSHGLAVACMTLALGTTSLGQAGFVANMSDIAPQHAGQMFGLCNTFGSLSGLIGVTAVGFVVEKTGSFNTVFQLTAVMYVVATLVWNLLCTGDRVF